MENIYAEFVIFYGFLSSSREPAQDGRTTASYILYIRALDGRTDWRTGNIRNTAYYDSCVINITLFCRKLRIQLLALACSSAEQSCLRHASSLFLSWINDRQPYAQSLSLLSVFYWNKYFERSSPDARQHRSCHLGNQCSAYNKI